MRALRAMAVAACLWAGACLPLPAQTRGVIPTADQVGAACMPDTLAPIRAPFEMPQLTRPVFPDHTRTLTAQELQQHRLASVAIQQAIDETSRRGGGTVIVPSGVWNVGRIELKSRVNLHLSEGAELHFSGRVEDYLPVVFTRSAGVEGMSLGSFVYACGQENIALTGKGRLIGPERDCPILKQNIGYGDFDRYIAYDKPATERIYDGHDGTAVFLPTFIGPVNCRNVLIEGVSLERSVFWNIVPTYCDGVIIRGVTVNSAGIPTGDGMDIESCCNVLIEYNTISAGDDCFTLKAGRGIDGLRVNRPSENIVLRYNLALTGHGGITCGSETAGVIRNVYAHDCVFQGTDVGLRFKTRRPRGGGGEQLYYERIRMNLHATAIHFDMLGSSQYVGSLAGRAWVEPDRFTPFYRQVRISDVVVEDATHFLKVSGIPESPATDVRISRATSNSGQLIRIHDMDGLVLEDAELTSPDNTVEISDGRNLRFERVSFKVDGGRVYRQIDGKLSSHINFVDCTPEVEAKP